MRVFTEDGCHLFPSIKLTFFFHFILHGVKLISHFKEKEGKKNQNSTLESNPAVEAGLLPSCLMPLSITLTSASCRKPYLKTKYIVLPSQ